MMQASAAKANKTGRKGMEISSNKCMLKGKNGKYAGFYLSAQALQAKGKPIDKTPQSTKMTQNKERCAAAYLCKITMPLSNRHRCIVCAFCMHPECGYELRETSQHKIPSTSVNQLCKACALGGDIKSLSKRTKFL